MPVLLSTESAGEGRNLQFCHVMINMDLPWNPMQIEQRLGRLHRIGQQHDVVLANLVSRGVAGLVLLDAVADRRRDTSPTSDSICTRARWWATPSPITCAPA